MNSGFRQEVAGIAKRLHEIPPVKQGFASGESQRACLFVD
jgi:hypothetical protein